MGVCVSQNTVPLDGYKSYECGFSFIDHETMYIVEENYTILVAI